jgi:uncharacterized protein involved in response to NO
VIELHVAAPGRTASRPAVLAKGFRPFFLGAAVYGVVAVPLWLVAFAGRLDVGGTFVPMYWHAHEMLFGFAVAVIAGFLLTAVGNWTSRETATGPLLAALVALWVLGRVALLAARQLPPVLVAGIDLAFLPALAWVLARPLVAAGNKRNYAFLGILALLFGANLVMHLDALGALPGAAAVASRVGVDLVILVILVIGGRIIPAFTRSATGVSSIRSHRWLDGATLGGMLGVVALEASSAATAASVAAALTGVLAAARAIHWGARHSLREPLLWVLHVGYAWVPVGLVLRGVALHPAVAATAATHALTLGAIGTLTLGMMARVALGHTGRPLVASRRMTLAFVAIPLAALVRVVTAIIAGPAAIAGAHLAGTLWALAFLLFLSQYASVLTRPRADGRPG